MNQNSLKLNESVTAYLSQPSQKALASKGTVLNLKSDRNTQAYSNEKLHVRTKKF